VVEAAAAGTAVRRQGPRLDVIGLGPAGPELMTAESLRLVEAADRVVLRTTRHPAAASLAGAESFDHHYEELPTFDAVYRAIVADLVAAVRSGRSVVYAVPGSPAVAERTVVLLRRDPAVVSGEVEVSVHPALSFLDLVFSRLGVDPVASGVRVVDGETFAADAAGERGPLVVAQCWSRAILSEIKLSADWATSGGAEPVVTVLHHLGLADEVVREVGWDELDRSFAPDHLTALWIPAAAAPVGRELVQLDELMHTLRRRCPWDRDQTHGSLARHLLEETYEVLEAIDRLGGASGDGRAEERAVADLEEELGDLLFQVYFHATLAEESGWFTLADVARGVHDKLVSRHPHLFGDGVGDGAGEGTDPERLDRTWEALKKAEKGRASITDGIPRALPALALAAKLQRKALTVGAELPGVDAEVARMTGWLEELATRAGDGDGGRVRGPTRVGGGGRTHDDLVAELLFSLVNLARLTGGSDPEGVLRQRATAFRDTVRALE
jgi:tetrapyrrole methylase family protein/MazG family protein